MNSIDHKKNDVKKFWNIASCGEDLYLNGTDIRDAFNKQSIKRYTLEPYIIPFLNFPESNKKNILEIGVGLGADHQKIAMSGLKMYGIDLTERAIKYTKERLDLFSLESELLVSDAENLPFDNDKFDYVYSWGVIHHSPNTTKAVKEIYRVLKKDGEARIMIYHKYSFVGFMLWFRYGFLRFKPFMTLNEIYAKYLESPGTKAYSYKEAKILFSDFKTLSIDTVLTHGDLLTSEAGQRHRGAFLTIAKIFFPRLIIKKLFPKNGLFMLINVTK
jgi:ubiquinone/menaquinone biosynthesis C-methylase UbiE